MPDISNPTPPGADLSHKNPSDAIAEILMGTGDAEAETPPAEEPAHDPQTDELDDEPEFEAPEGEPDDSQDEAAAASDEEESLASLLGLDEDLLIVDEETGDLAFKTKVNGKEGKATLAEMLKGYQFNVANNEKAQELAAQRKAFEEAQKEGQERIAQQLQQVEGLAMMWQQELLGEYQKVDWNELRRLDPGEYAAKQADFNQRQQKLQQVGQYMAQYHQQKEAERQQELQAQRAERLNEQRAIMLQNNPSWADEKVLSKEMGELRDFVQTQYGFTEADVATVDDARLIELIKDAAAFRKGKSVAQKRNKPVPPRLQRAANGRFIKPKRQNRLDKLVNAAKSAKGANKRELQKDAVAALLMGET